MNKSGLYWLTAGAFLVGTSELVIAGILDRIAVDLGVSLVSAGQLITVYSFVFAVGSPALVLLTARMERRRLLLLSLALFIAGCLTAVFSGGYAAFIVSRVILALSAGIYTAVSLHVGTALAPPDKKGSAAGTILLGSSGSMVLGVPLGVIITQAYGWRAIFACIAVLACFVLLAIRHMAPHSAADNRTASEGGAAAQNGRRLTGSAKEDKAPAADWRRAFDRRTNARLLISLLWITGYSVVYTYISPLLQLKAGIAEQHISLVLLLFGVLGLLGTYAGGKAADKQGVSRTLAFSITLHAAALFAMYVLGNSPLPALALLSIWGASSWMTLPALQVYFATLSSRHSGLLLSLNSSVIHLGIAAGAGFGGIAISYLPLDSTGWIGGLIVAASLLPLVYSFRKGGASRRT